MSKRPFKWAMKPMPPNPSNEKNVGSHPKVGASCLKHFMSKYYKVMFI